MCVQVVCLWLPQRLKSTFLQLFNYITTTALHFKKSRKILAFDAKHCKFHKLHCFHIFQCFFDNALNKVVGYIIQKRSSSNQQQKHQSVCLSTVLPVANLPPVISDYWSSQCHAPLVIHGKCWHWGHNPCCWSVLACPNFQSIKVGLTVGLRRVVLRVPTI